jgi:hypothetical protein
MVCFAASAVCFEASTLCFAASAVCFEASMLRFTASAVCFEASTLRFTPSAVCFEALMLCFAASAVCFEASMMLFRTINRTLRSLDVWFSGTVFEKKTIGGSSPGIAMAGKAQNLRVNDNDHVVFCRNVCSSKPCDQSW